MNSSLVWNSSTRHISCFQNSVEKPTTAQICAWRFRPASTSAFDRYSPPFQPGSDQVASRMVSASRKQCGVLRAVPAIDGLTFGRNARSAITWTRTWARTSRWTTWPGRWPSAGSISPACSARRWGTSPHEFVLQPRLARARALLSRTDEPLPGIAASSGFADQSHMNRVLRKRVGQNPGQFRASGSR